MVASICTDVLSRGPVTALSGLDIEALSLWRGERMLFRDLAFSVSAGEALQLEGPNGSGKTSLLRAIAGFLEPRAGTIRVRTNGGEFASGEERAEFIGWSWKAGSSRRSSSAISTASSPARWSSSPGMAGSSSIA